MMDLTGKRVKVVGMGLSGVAAAEACLRRGARVVGVDQRSRDELDGAARELPIEIVTGSDLGQLLGGADLIVVSPGVGQAPALDAAAAAGTPVIAELELGARLVEAPICAIGGTNGKSTVTELASTMLSAAGRRVFCGGNLGTPLTRAVDGPWDCLVVEVSSFQLERTRAFKPKVSALLNVTEDHLDRHGTFGAYAAAKGNAFVNQGPEDVAVLPFGDAVVEAQARRGRGRRVYFGSAGDYVVRELEVVESASGERFSLAGSALVARHNRANAAAAIAVARAMSAPAAAVRAALSSYRLLPHRLARVASVRGVSFYDDSKATNVGAAVAAIESVSEPKVVLVAGGKGKAGSYAPLCAALRERGRAVVLIGEAAPVIADALDGVVPAELAASLEQAVERAFELAAPGDAVLLAPACASFDMFRSYADRGERFVRAVQRLALAEEGRGS